MSKNRKNADRLEVVDAKAQKRKRVDGKMQQAMRSISTQIIEANSKKRKLILDALYEKGFAINVKVHGSNRSISNNVKMAFGCMDHLGYQAVDSEDFPKGFRSLKARRNMVQKISKGIAAICKKHNGSVVWEDNQKECVTSYCMFRDWKTADAAKADVDEFWGMYEVVSRDLDQEWNFVYSRRKRT